MFRAKRARAAAIVASGVLASSVGVMALSGGTATEAVGASAAIGGTCTGIHQGVIKADGSVAGHAGWWAVSHLSDGMTTPFDPATGAVNGRRAEHGIKISMAASPATIGLLNAQTANETLTSCTFTFYRPTATGALQAYFQLRLNNAIVVSYGLSASPTSGAATEFMFIPQHILRTWLPTGASSSDSWNPVV